MADTDFARLHTVIRAYQRSQAVAVAARLGLADLLADGPRPVAALAEKTGSDADTLYRLLRALASIEVFHEDDDGRFSLTGAGEYLRRDHPLSLDPVARMFCADYEWRAWGALEDGVRTGATVVGLTEGSDVWTYRRAHPEAGATFDDAMRTLTRVAVRGILFDQPHVVDDADAVPGGVRHRIDVVGGSFFEAVPAGADCYLLRRILHDWPDDECRTILTRIREVLPPDGRVLVLDAVVGPPNTDPEAAFLDLMMLVSAGGRERTAPQWEALVGGTGFRVVGTTSATPNLSVIELAADRPGTTSR